MKGSVKQLYDVEKISIPEDMLDVHVDEEKIDGEVRNLSLRYAEEIFVDTAEEGDLVYCIADKSSYPDGRTILIYTGLNMPGAEKAEKDVLKKSVGDIILTELMDRDVELTIKKILRRIPVSVDDHLVAKIGLENVKTVDEYRDYIRNRNEQNILTEKKKEMEYFLMTELIDNSIFAYNEQDMEEYIQSVMDEYASEMAEMELEQSPDEIRDSIEFSAKQILVAKALCEKINIQIDKKAAEDEAAQMIEMMELMGENIKDKSSIIDRAIENAYMNEMFGYLERIVEQKLGGANGND